MTLKTGSKQINDNQPGQLNLRVLLRSAYAKSEKFSLADNDTKEKVKAVQATYSLVKKIIESDEHKKLSNQLLERQQALVKSLKGKLVTVETVGRFVADSSSPSPLGLYFSVDFITGVSIIPATQIKGSTTAAIEALNQNDWFERSKKVFGSLNSIAQVSVTDGFAHPDSLKIIHDVTTPHYRTYYENDPEDPNKEFNEPYPWLEPEPLSFFAIEGKFTFGLVPQQNTKSDELKSLLSDAERMILFGLSESGVGAKTATGYGYFEKSENINQTEDKSKQKAKSK